MHDGDTVGDRIPWQRAYIADDGTISLFGHPTPDALWLTLQRVTEAELAAANWRELVSS